MYYPQANPTKCLKVSGEGSIFVSPNQAKITLGAFTENQSLQVAQQENTLIMGNVIRALEQLGIPKEKIQTVSYRIDPIYDFKDGTQLLRGYRVTHQLQIILDEVDLSGKAVDVAVNNGANSVSNIEFTVSQPDAYYNEALKIALINAYGKAISLVSQLPVKLNPVPVKIEEYSTTISPPVPFSAPIMLKAEATPVQPGDIKITASITALYLYC